MNSNYIIDESPKKKYIKFNEIIGQGSYKIVNKGLDTYNGNEIAWNTINTDILSDMDKKRISEEIEILKECSNKNAHILNMNNYWYDQELKNVIIITQYCPSGNIRNFINKIKKLRINIIIKWLKQILSAIGFLHSKNIIHRDIKLTNIFLNNGNAILGDMGLAKKTTELTFSPLGTPEYMAPEIYTEKYDEKIDIYSFGLCISELFTGEIPYNEFSNFTKIWKAVTNNIKPNNLLKIKDIELLDIIKKCINFNPNKRPSIRYLLNSNYLNNNENNYNFVIYKNRMNENSDSLNTLNKVDQ